MYFDLNYVIEQVGKEKGIPKEIIVETLGRGGSFSVQEKVR